MSKVLSELKFLLQAFASILNVAFQVVHEVTSKTVSKSVKGLNAKNVISFKKQYTFFTLKNKIL